MKQEEEIYEQKLEEIKNLFPEPDLSEEAEEKLKDKLKQELFTESTEER